MGTSQSNVNTSSFWKKLWRLLIEPSPTIQNRTERMRIRLVTSLLLFFVVAITGGILNIYFTSPYPFVALRLAGAQFFILVAYFISRTKYYRISIILTLIVLLFIPIAIVAANINQNHEFVITIMISGLFSILLASAVMSLRTTIFLSVINFSIILLFPIFIKDFQYANFTAPIVFNATYPIMIMVLTHHRNKVEIERTEEINQINKQLQFELKERKKIEEILAHSAMHDPLTDLPNRTLFAESLTHAISFAKRHNDFSFAVCFIDLDRFKVVNDSLGHYTGDLLLIESAKRIQSCIRAEDTLGRLGGDEFVLLLEGAEDPKDYLQIVHRIQEKMTTPAIINEHTVYISVSIGVVLDTKNYDTADEILRNADIAMYRTKTEGRGHYKVFETAMLEGVLSRIEMESDLRDALENNEFILHYQPILKIDTKQISGFEALIRWQHPQKGLIPPNDFIGISEDMGLIVSIGYWVIDKASRQMKQWQMQYDPELTINVNLSTHQFSQPDLAEKIFAILKKNKINPASLKLELTESLIIKDIKTISTTLNKLRNFGIEVQIDDFGTGYSSLGYLHTLPIDTLKIDRTFVNQLGSDKKGADIIHTILKLAHGMGMKVIAEGVETKDQLSLLESMECEYAQGFLFAKAVTSQEASILLKNQTDNWEIGKQEPDPR
jgi:diguanylate cyclase (GGDEF)-like protein